MQYQIKEIFAKKFQDQTNVKSGFLNLKVLLKKINMHAHLLVQSSRIFFRLQHSENSLQDEITICFYLHTYLGYKLIFMHT